MPEVIHSDVLPGLASLPAAWFHCAATSPPYWRLRSYAGVAPTLWADGQSVCLGAEADPDSFVRHLVQVFAGVWRVLREDGCLFVNLGETYADDSKYGGSTGGKHVKGLHGAGGPARRRVSSGLQPGDRCGIPARFALAMQASGWIWRDEVQWIKRSPMPMSRSGWRWVRCRVKVSSQKPAADAGLYAAGSGNRMCRPGSGGVTGEMPAEFKTKWSPCPGCAKCLPHNGMILRKGRFATTSAHEPIFMFVKSGEYFCDSEAVSEPAVYADSGRASKKRGEFNSKAPAPMNGRDPFRAVTQTRLPRSYLLLSNEPSKEKHFASYPSRIPRFAIEMATSKAGCCPKCGSPYAPVVESERVPTRPALNSKTIREDHDGWTDRYRSSEEAGNRDPERHVARTNVKGYWPSCECAAGEPVPCRVLDPFAGTGTSLQVAHHLGRDATGIEASADYVAICERKMRTPLRTKGDKPKPKPAPPQAGQLTLFP